MAKKTVLITGCSSGFGKLTAQTFHANGWNVIATMRSPENETELTQLDDVLVTRLDVTDSESVRQAVDEGIARFGAIDVLVNNAGFGGHALFEQFPDETVRAMYDTNVLGTLRMTKALLPALRASGDGLVVVIGSIAGSEAYVGGAGYNAAKFAERAFAEALRKELFTEPVRVTEIEPGIVETDFSLVRFEGDADRAARVYEGVEALSAQDVAECVAFVATRPARVNIDQMVVLARDQLGATNLNRRPT